MVKKFLEQLHNRLGDFWWYSLMIFLASRLADSLNVFVGLYLVPKYVSPAELGAVQPLTGFANIFTIPAIAFASTFRQELTNLAERGEFGKMKSLMRSVFITTAILFATAMIISRFILPSYLSIIRVAEGSLGLLILATSFISAISPTYTNALQSLKKFKAISLINMLSAPVRLIAMVVTMPLRALSGYFVGQGSTPAFQIFIALFALRKELKIKAERYWSREIIGRLSLIFVAFTLLASVQSMTYLFESTVIRSRLPEVESAAYYMITRFSEIAAFIFSALSITIFPFAAEAAAKGRSTLPIVLKSWGAIAVVNGIIALFFVFFGELILELLPYGEAYAQFHRAIPWSIGIVSLGHMTSTYICAETAANRFKFLWWFAPLSALYVFGIGFASIPSIYTMLIWMSGFAFLKLVCCFVAISVRKA